MGKQGVKHPNQSRYMKERNAIPENIKKISEQSTRRWADPEYKARMGAAIAAGQRRRWANAKYKVNLIASRPDI